MTVDLCGFCGGDLHASDVEAGWVFVCQVCGRETILSDSMMTLVIDDLDPIEPLKWRSS